MFFFLNLGNVFADSFKPQKLGLGEVTKLKSLFYSLLYLKGSILQGFTFIKHRCLKVRSL